MTGAEVIGREVIGREEVSRAEDTLRRYRQGKERLEARVIENEQWYKLRHWAQMGGSANPGDPEPASAWLLNCIANKHADAMDNFPEPNVLPREESDRLDAQQLSDVLPVVLAQCAFEKVYSDVWWYKLKTGTGVYGVFWSPTANRGLGDIDIRQLDLLNLFWEPGVRDIQKSRDFFHVDLVDHDLLEEQYPQLKDTLAAPTVDVKQYVYDDTVDVSRKAAVVDWYYKRMDGQRELVHYCKFCNGRVLYASENDPAYARRGFYDHGLYPVVFDVLFAEEGTPVGFGYVDVCKQPQMYIDKLNQVILKHAVMGARPRWFVRGDGQINEAEYADWTKDFVHYHGTGNPAENIHPIAVDGLSDIYVAVMRDKVEELKETSGNRDFSQGGTASGVTAASAIAALQEAGSKLSRDMIKASYRAFVQINHLVIELIRQFWDEPRWFRILGPAGEMQFQQFSNSGMRPQAQGADFGIDMGYRMPIYDIQVTSQKSSPFSTVAQNERAKELYGMGFFRPDLADQALAALEMMDFEGIEAVRQRVGQNGTMFQQLQQMQAQMAQMAQMAQIIDAQNGTTIAAGMMAGHSGAGAAQAPAGAAGAEMDVNALGEAAGRADRNTAGAARLRAANMARPKT